MRLPGGSGSGRSGWSEIGAGMYQQFPESVWVEPAYRCAAADGCKTTTIFSVFKNFSKIQYAVATDLVDSKNCKSSWRQQHVVHVEFRISNEKPGLPEKAQDRVVCYHVAKLHTTMWQSPIKVAGADHAV